MRLGNLKKFSPWIGKYAPIFLTSIITAFLSLLGYAVLNHESLGFFEGNDRIPANYASFVSGKEPGGPVDFTEAATATVPTVVHIKTRTKEKIVSGKSQPSNPFGDLFGNIDPFGDMFGGGNGRQIIPEERASGSGVIVSSDGYIVTNNHVVQNADEIKVTLTNKKTYTAQVVGTDPSSDLAVIKIKATNLPSILYGNSDELKLGQWVLAIGYPLSLDVTVTAGIVSAKSRSIGINSQNGKIAAPIESFIQTDAAVNKGNSGGALINTKGELVGINSAIASETGSYAGYSYAIPSNIVRKVVNDIIKYGKVQRAFLGIVYTADDNNMTDDQKGAGLGVYVTDVTPGTAAAEAGIQKGDVITAINGAKVQTGADLMGIIARYKPGDIVTLDYTKDGRNHQTKARLKNQNSIQTEIAGTNFQKLGAVFATVDAKTANINGIPGGVKVISIEKNGTMKDSKIENGFIITAVNGTEVKNIEEFKNVLNGISDESTIYIDGFYPGPAGSFPGSYRYPLRLK